MRRAIYPGSFDPVTNGHLDVIERARKLFDQVIVAVAHNDEKQPLFSLNERLDLLRESVPNGDNVRIAIFEGLLVDFAKKEHAGAVIRGLACDFGFRIRISDGVDEPKTGSRRRNDIFNAKGGIHLFEFTHREGNRATGRRRSTFRARERRESALTKIERSAIDSMLIMKRSVLRHTELQIGQRTDQLI